MKILLIEDKQEHIDAAKRQLLGHELTICTSYDEAEKVFTGGDHWYKEEAIFPFDVVLTDLFLPPSPTGVGPFPKRTVTELFGAEIPYGLVFALAAARRGVPVAIVTDASHHHHPLNWALDLLGFDGMKKVQLGNISFLGSWNGTRSKEDTSDVKDWNFALKRLFS